MKVNLDEIKSTVEDKSTYTDRLLVKLPGYDNYIKKKQFYEMDRIVREYLAKNILDIKSKIQNIIQDVVDEAKLEFVKPLESITLNLERIFKKFQYASFGDSSKTNNSDNQDEAKNRLIEYDWRLISKSEILEEKCANLTLQNKDLESSLKEFKADILKLESEFDSRKEVLSEEI